MVGPRLPQKPTIARVNDQLCPGLVGDRHASALPQEDGADQGLHRSSIPPSNFGVSQFAKYTHYD